MDEKNAREFLRYVKKFGKGQKQRCGVVNVDKITPIQGRKDPDADHENDKESKYVCVDYNSIPECPEDYNLTHELLNKIAVLKLNGGLGTTMVCSYYSCNYEQIDHFLRVAVDRNLSLKYAIA